MGLDSSSQYMLAAARHGWHKAVAALEATGARLDQQYLHLIIENMRAEGVQTLGRCGLLQEQHWQEVVMFLCDDWDGLVHSSDCQMLESLLQPQPQPVPASAAQPAQPQQPQWVQQSSLPEQQQQCQQPRRGSTDDAPHSTAARPLCATNSSGVHVCVGLDLHNSNANFCVL